jgi:hypothetical protein
MSNPNEPNPSSETPVDFLSDVEERKVQFGNVDYSKTQHLRFYANHVATNATLFEIRLILSDVDVVGTSVAAVQTVTVLMSPEIAKLTHMVLGRSLENYEKLYGETRLPDSATTKNPNTESDGH